MIDKNYCMSSFLMFRTIIDRDKFFTDSLPYFYVNPPRERFSVRNSLDLEKALKQQIESISQKHEIALALSGGIDSAILARFMPKGSMAYTFKCIVPGIKVKDESPIAARYAKECGLKHKIIEIYWEDFEKYAPILMKHKGCPIHSIECQMYKAALVAKADGIDTLIYGESADLLYGGLSNLLSKDWTFGEFVDRYSYIKPYYVLKSPIMVYDPFKNNEENGYINIQKFFANDFFKEAINSYHNANATAGMGLLMPYSNTQLAIPFDYERIRRGENKYIIRELFQKLYPNFAIPPKLPMPRPMNEWLKNWDGPKREEFIPNCHHNLSGDQKWLIWSLEKFLDLLDRL